ncbi:MAG: hypothetical protein ACK4IX_18640 [Candidatus Sericytochromatia bacterium]
MSDLIEQTEKLLQVLKPNTKKVTDINKILVYIDKNKDKNIIMYLPFNNSINNEFFEYIPVVVQNKTKDKLFFIKTFKTTYLDFDESNINESKSQEDSIDIKELISLSKRKNIIAFIEE